LDAVDVDQTFGAGEAELEHGEKRLASSQDFGIVLISGQQLYGLGKRLGAEVLEAVGIHG
jgi:hypothetical protein